MISVFLLDDHEIVSLPSAGVLAALRSESAKQRYPDKQVAILADPVFSLEDPRFSVDDMLDRQVACYARWSGEGPRGRGGENA